ncbi:hypothetical protein [Mycobacteroides abscessus]|uniref:hypothetical protein n=1 Tax=Mycobacteroides abscessus TaxID=36809 RepID=UPI0006986BF4|nr:hypothetical protein [Mycobacteroides abscessus]
MGAQRDDGDRRDDHGREADTSGLVFEHITAPYPQQEQRDRSKRYPRKDVEDADGELTGQVPSPFRDAALSSLCRPGPTSAGRYLEWDAAACTY